MYEIFNILLITAKTGALLYSGGLENQPAWYIELLSEFLQRYDILSFSQKAEMVLGSDDKVKSSFTNTSNMRGSRNGRY